MNDTGIRPTGAAKFIGEAAKKFVKDFGVPAMVGGVGGVAGAALGKEAGKRIRERMRKKATRKQTLGY